MTPTIGVEGVVFGPKVVKNGKGSMLEANNIARPSRLVGDQGFTNRSSVLWLVSPRAKSKLHFPMDDTLPIVSEVESCFEISTPLKPPILCVYLRFEENDPSMTREDEEVTSNRNIT